MPYALGPILGLVLLGASPIEQPEPGKLVEHVSCPADPSQTFSLYLPSAYVTTRRWPLLLVFDPGGRGARAAEVFREAAERYGWIVAASENARNGPWEPTLRAVNAMWPALLGGYAVDERRVYTAGHSGGASVAWNVAQQTGQIAGVIASGQPNNGADRGKAQFAWFGAAGHADFNFLEVKSIDEQLAKSGATRRVEFFDGGHQWPPADLTLRALGWMEVVAMKEGRRPRDVAFAGSILAEDMARARGLEDRGLLTEAWQSYRSIADSYSGLVEIADATARKRAIEADARFKNLRKRTSAPRTSTGQPRSGCPRKSRARRFVRGGIRAAVARAAPRPVIVARPRPGGPPRSAGLDPPDGARFNQVARRRVCGRILNVPLRFRDSARRRNRVALPPLDDPILGE